MAFPQVTRETAAAVGRALRSHGVTLSNVEYFPLKADTPIQSFREALALGADLGGRRAVTHVHEQDEGLARDLLGAFADLAAGYGLSVGLEFLPLSHGCATLQQALALCRAVERPNLGVAIDALHLVRSGGTIAEVRNAPPSGIAYAQLCDGRGLHPSSIYGMEALDRLMPGTGDFPLRALLQALPPSVDLDVEVPCPIPHPPARRAAEAFACTQTLLHQARVPS